MTPPAMMPFGAKDEVSASVDRWAAVLADAITNLNRTLEELNDLKNQRESGDGRAGTDPPSGQQQQ